MEERMESDSPRGSKRAISTPHSKSGKKIKFGVVSTPVKKMFSSPQKLSSQARRCATPVLKSLRRMEYRPALKQLLTWKGYRSNSDEAYISIIKTEIRDFLRLTNCHLFQDFCLESVERFNWTDCIQEFGQHCPTCLKFLIAMLSPKFAYRYSLESFPSNLIPTLGMLIGIAMNARNRRRCRLLQDMLAVEMYICCSPKKLLNLFNKLHIAVGPATTRKKVDKLVQEYKSIMATMKFEVEKTLAEGRRRSRRALSFTNMGQKKKAQPFGYTFCWDNTQIDVKSRHQTQDKNVKMILWALCYAAKNRVRTEHLSDTQTFVKASDIPMHVFLPSPSHDSEVREWLALHIKDSLITFLCAFKGLKHPGLPKHQYWEELGKKSEVINLGVLDENPSTTAGAIGIMDFLSTKVPLYPDGRPYTIITHCDGGAFERMVSARKVRAPDRSRVKKLLGVEMSAQEFHKRGIMLQIIMDKYFNGASQTQRGTLANIKAVMGQKSVKTKVMDAFNHVEDMFDFICDGFICLLAMEMLDLATLDQTLPVTESEKNVLLDQTVQRMISAIWCHPTKQQVNSVVKAAVKPHKGTLEVCCQQEVPGDIITCSNPQCPSGGLFHAFCVETITGEHPSKEDDWWCSPTCEKHSKFCTCKTYIDDADMVECHKGKKCQHGQWFHPQCVGLSALPADEDKWFCPSCCQDSQAYNSDGVYEYSKGLLWMLLSDRLRRTAIRTGNGPMMMSFWVDDGIHFWKHGHHKYLLLMHRMTAGINGWLPERQAADLTWNRTVNLHGRVGRNIPMDKYNEFLNCDFKGNLKSSRGKYTKVQTERSSHLAGQVARQLHSMFASNIAEEETPVKIGFRNATKAQISRVKAFVKEYKDDQLFRECYGREHVHFPDFNARKLHQEIKNPSDLKRRLLDYSVKLDRARYAEEMCDTRDQSQ